MDWIAIATIIRVKSRNEGFVLRCKAGLSSCLEAGMEVFFIPPELDLPRRAVISEFSEAAAGEVAVQFEEAFSADVAGKLIGKTVLVDRASCALPDEGDDVTGWPVEDARFGLLGTVRELVDGPAQQLLVVQGADGLPEEILIPFVEELVVVDAAAGVLRSSIPAGLLRLGD